MGIISNSWMWLLNKSLFEIGVFPIRRYEINLFLKFGRISICGMKLISFTQIGIFSIREYEINLQFSFGVMK